MGTLNKFGPAVWPAIAYIKIYEQSEKLYYVDFEPNNFYKSVELF